MRFGRVPVAEAEGALLAHTLRLEGGTLRKGLLLEPTHLSRLREEGYAEVQVARLESGDVREGEAARALAETVAGPNVEVGEPFTGRCNLRAARSGLVAVDAGAVERLNAIDEGMTLATLAPDTRVSSGALVATAKIIPFAVAAASLEAARELVGREAPLRLHPFRRHRASLVLTELPGLSGALMEKGEAALRRRLERAGSSLDRVERVAHEVEALAAVLAEHLERGYDPVLVLGASAVVDRGDVLPVAVERAGGTVEHLGLPVDPGNLLLLAGRGGSRVVGVPGCARSPRPSGFDLVLHRLLAGLPLTREVVARMGVGGLLKEIPGRPAPRSGRRGGPSAPGKTAATDDGDEGPGRVGAVVLAAGRSSRMEGTNKLLEEVAGAPLLLRAVDAVLGAPATPVVVVTGHDAEAVERLLRERPVRIVRNPAWRKGMAGSLARGVEALEESGGASGVLVTLADMPDLAPRHVVALIEAFREAGEERICVPVHAGKRGHPVLFPTRLFPELGALTGDEGARSILAAEADVGASGAVVEVPVDDPAVLLDLDTREALESYRAHENGGQLQ